MSETHFPVVEGVMGYFDGLGEHHSSQFPGSGEYAFRVVLVVDARSQPFLTAR
ncbi:MAG: hypothetical protein ACLT0W_04520 [Clostridium sp.]